MNVTVGIVTSFIVGGLLMVALMNLNTRIMQNSADVTASQMVKQKVETVKDFVEFDFRKIGYVEGGKLAYNNKILKAEPDKITFNTDLEQDGVADNLSWHFDTSTPVTETENPNDYLLTRTYAGSTIEIKQGVTKFSLKYYTRDGIQITTPDDTDSSLDSLKHIEKIRISLICESSQSIARNQATDQSTYAKSFWEKTITPWNLKD